MSDFDSQQIIPDLPQTLFRLGRKYSGQAPDPINVLYPALSAASPRPDRRCSASTCNASHAARTR